MDGGTSRIRLAPGSGDPDILGLTADSRTVRPGYLFAALAGARADGRSYLADALKRGAAAVLAAADEAPAGLAVPVIADPNPRRLLALMAARFHAPQPKTVAAVTGTNGKTSIAVFARQLWTAQGFKAASIGTIGLVAPGIERAGSLTTPDPVELHRELQTLARTGVDHLALEASSHGLEQFRLDGVDLAAAAFTNLTRDHLDYHGDMAHYFAAKKRLFAELLPAGGAAVINADIPEAPELIALAKSRGHKLATYGTAANATLRLLSVRPTEPGLAVEIVANGVRRALTLPLIGDFQAMNALAALGLALATGVTLDVALDALAKLQGAPGRMEIVARHPSGGPAIVDYAHTPDALEAALTALRPHAQKRLIVVFGAGGDRDAGKRPLMGAIAERLADIAIVTDDNPRSEDAALIRRAILASCPKGREIGDRREAIRAGAKLMSAGDLLLVAGKGHETGQIAGGKTLPFNDKDETRAAIAVLGGRA